MKVDNCTTIKNFKYVTRDMVKVCNHTLITIFQECYLTHKQWFLNNAHTKIIGIFYLFNYIVWNKVTSRGAQIFWTSWNHLTFLDSRRVTGNKFITDDPHTLITTVSSHIILLSFKIFFNDTVRHHDYISQYIKYQYQVRSTRSPVEM
jgi:hypothetical protein